MKIQVQLEKQLTNVIDTNVNVKKNIVGKVIKYDKETGLSTIEMDEKSLSEIGWNPIAGQNIGISSRKL